MQRGTKLYILAWRQLIATRMSVFLEISMFHTLGRTMEDEGSPNTEECDNMEFGVIEMGLFVARTPSICSRT
jgi:hypothetical protein